MFFDAILTVCNDLSRSADLLVLVLVLDELEILVHLGDQAGRRRMFLGDSGVAFLQLHLVLHACIETFDVMIILRLRGLWVGTKQGLC